MQPCPHLPTKYHLSFSGSPLPCWTHPRYLPHSRCICAWIVPLEISLKIDCFHWKIDQFVAVLSNIFLFLLSEQIPRELFPEVTWNLSGINKSKWLHWVWHLQNMFPPFHFWIWCILNSHFPSKDVIHLCEPYLCNPIWHRSIILLATSQYWQFD